MVTKKQKKRLGLLMAVLILVTAVFSVCISFMGGVGERTEDSLLDVSAQDVTGVSASPYVFVNVSVTDSENNPIKNVWVVAFQNERARFFSYTGANGTVSFQVLPGNYVLQFEKYHYVSSALPVTISKDVDIEQVLEMEEAVIFGVPSWAVTLIIGLIVLGLVYWNRASLKLGKWKRPYNWFGASKTGTWTFIDKSTKTVLYGISGCLLVFLIIIVIPNIPVLQDMAYYYIVLGVLALIGLFMEGHSKKYPFAALGFGKKNEVVGDILIGFLFAILFISVIGFMSQLSIIDLGSSTTPFFTLLLVIFVASFFEEAFHSGILAPTIAEKSGIVSSIFLTSFIFMLGHGLTYGWTAIPLMGAFSFRIVATSIVLYKKSWLGVFVAHAIINALSIIVIMIYMG